jgi:hypothetical protein
MDSVLRRRQSFGRLAVSYALSGIADTSQTAASHKSWVAMRATSGARSRTADHIPMPPSLKTLLAFAAGALLAFVVARPTQRRDSPVAAAAPAPAASSWLAPSRDSIPTAGGERQPGIPSAGPVTAPSNPHPMGHRALARLLRDLQRHPPPVDSKPMDPEKMEAALGGIRAGLVQGDSK